MDKKIDLQTVKNMLKHLNVKLFISDYNALSSGEIKMCARNTNVLEPECLYICRGSNLPDISDISSCINMICLQDKKIPEPYIDGKINMLVIKKQMSLPILFNMLQDVLNYQTNSKASALIEAVTHGKGLRHVINLGYELLGNPFVMIDLSYRLLANTPNNIEDDVLWNELTANGVFSHETAYFFNGEKFIEGFANAESTVLMKSGGLKYDRIAGKIFDTDGSMLASITVVGCYKPFIPDDYDLIRLLCEMIALVLQNSTFYKKLESVYHETLICDLIEDRVMDKAKIYQRVEDLYADLKDNLFIAIIDITRYDQSHSHISYLRDLLEEMQSEFKFYIYGNNIVVLISTLNAEIDDEKDLQVLYTFFEKYNIVAGISNSFQNLFEIRTYYKQALNALNYGMEIHVKKIIFKYDDYRIDYLLNYLTNDPNAMEICHPIVFSIQEFDKENGSSYADVLYAYFQSGMNTLLASEAVNMEHTAFCEELKRIKKKFKIDLNNGNLLMHMYVSFKFLKHLSCSL